MHDRCGLGFLRNAEGHNECQEHLEPRHQPGADPRGEVINGTLVGSAPSPKGQDKCVDDDYGHHDKETRRNDRKRGADHSEPPDLGW